MSRRSRRPLLPAAAFSLAAACCAASTAAGPAEPAVVAAQLSAMPTSPGFKMCMNKGDTGAPEATAIGAMPIERKASSPVAPASAAAPGAARRPADATPAGARSAEARPADKAAAAKTAEAKPEAKDASPADPMDLLREKLAEKLGARSASQNKFVMRVSNRGESGENVVTAVRPSAGSLHRAAAKHAAAASQPGPSLAPTAWDYAGVAGPESWAHLQPGNAACATGRRQSPIDIRGGIAVDLEPIKFEYHPSAFSVVDNGHTVQVDVEPGNWITVTGRRYELLQFHFHRPSEERVDGRQFDMVAHLVHKDADGHVAVVAVLLDRGSAQPIVQTIWNNLPLEKGDAVKGGGQIDLAQLLPEDRRYYTYMGSLTTPPCTEGVLWMVMKQPVPISPEQVSIFAHLYPMNARPIQQADGRLIKESN